MGRCGYNLRVSGMLPAKYKRSAISCDRHIPELRALPGVSSVLPVSSLGHGYADWGRRHRDDLARPLRRHHHHGNHNYGRNGCGRNQPTTRMEESHSALDRHRSWNRGWYRRRMDWPAPDAQEDTVLSAAAFDTSGQHSRDSIGRTGRTKRPPVILGVAEDDETAMPHRSHRLGWRE